MDRVDLKLQKATERNLKICVMIIIALPLHFNISGIFYHKIKIRKEVTFW